MSNDEAMCVCGGRELQPGERLCPSCQRSERASSWRNVFMAIGSAAVPVIGVALAVITKGRVKKV